MGTSGSDDILMWMGNWCQSKRPVDFSYFRFETRITFMIHISSLLSKVAGF